MEIFLGLILLLAGMISIGGSLSNWGWFWNNRRARGLLFIMRKKIIVRVFYFILGVLVLIAGVVALIAGVVSLLS